MNLKENGMDVTIGLRAGSSSWKAAEEAGLTVKETAEAVKGADIVMVLIPDELQADVYANDIEPKLETRRILGIRSWLQHSLRQNRSS